MTNIRTAFLLMQNMPGVDEIILIGLIATSCTQRATAEYVLMFYFLFLFIP